MNEFIFYVADNDSKKDQPTGCGTIFEAKVTIKGVVEYIKWSIMDEINKAEPYKRMLELKTLCNKAKEDSYNERESSAKKAKEESLNNEVNSYKFSDNELNIIKNVLTDHKNDIQSYLNKGNEKAINPIMGKLLKQLSVKPYVLKCKILELINNGFDS